MPENSHSNPELKKRPSLAGVLSLGQLLEKMWRTFNPYRFYPVAFSQAQEQFTLASAKIYHALSRF